MNEEKNYEKLNSEIISIFLKHNLNLNMIYSFLAQTLCFYSHALNRDVNKVKDDIEIIFKSIPPAIEEINDDPNEQSDSP